MNTAEAFEFALDTPELLWLNSKESCLAGWFLPSKDLEPTAHLAVEVNGVFSPVYSGLRRDDVARHFGDSDVVDCGFIARFPSPGPDTSVRLVLRTANEDLVLNEFAAPQSSRRRAVRNKTAPKAPSTYTEWLKTIEPTLFWPENEIRSRLSALSYRPLISVIVPLYNTQRYFLYRCLSSVLQQQYAHLELCLVDDCSSDRRVLDYARETGAKDNRVQLIERKQQGGISTASNEALQKAKGDFVVLLDHDDELHPFALLEVARALNTNSEADLLYSDEDKIDTHGVRSQPAFKPDFDLDIFRTFNYLGHLIALRRTVASDIGGFRRQCDGAQDWDLLTRAIEAIGPHRIRHIQKPLYHWRIHAESTAYSLDAKPYARRAWVRVLSEHLARTGKEASIEPGIFDGSVRVKHGLPEDLKIAVLVRAQDGLFQSTVLGPQTTEGITTIYELIESSARPMPNGRHEEAARDLSLEPSSLVDMREDVFVFINRPLETLNHSFLEELAGQALRDDCGLVTGICISDERKVLHSGFITAGGNRLIDPFAGLDFPSPTYMSLLDVVRSVEAVSDHFFAVKRENLAAVGGFGAISTSQMPRLVHRLTQYARTHCLRVLVTPYAIASISEDKRERGQLSSPVGDKATVSMNVNIEHFSSISDVFSAKL